MKQIHTNISNWHYLLLAIVLAMLVLASCDSLPLPADGEEADPDKIEINGPPEKPEPEKIDINGPPEKPEIEKIDINGPPEPPPGFTRKGIDDLGGIAKIPEDGSSLYFYLDGERVPLTLSLNWITIKFSTNDAAAQKKALDTLKPLAEVDRKSLVPGTDVYKLPLRSGISEQTLLANINLLRINTDLFTQVNPVFEINEFDAAMTNEFIVVYAAHMNPADIKVVNDSYGVSEKSELEEADGGYLLQYGPTSTFDALMLANLYFESGYAESAMPLFYSEAKQ